MPSENRSNQKDLKLLVLGLAVTGVVGGIALHQITPKTKTKYAFPSEVIAPRGFDFYLNVKQSDSPERAPNSLDHYLTKQLNFDSVKWSDDSKISFVNTRDCQWRDVARSKQYGCVFDTIETNFAGTRRCANVLGWWDGWEYRRSYGFTNWAYKKWIDSECSPRQIE